MLDRFGDAHAKFLNVNPEYEPRSPHTADFTQVWGRVDGNQSQLLHPEYTCLSCLWVATCRPLLDLKVEAIVSWYGSVHGIQPPNKMHAPSEVNTLFDGYGLE